MARISRSTVQTRYAFSLPQQLPHKPCATPVNLEIVVKDAPDFLAQNRIAPPPPSPSPLRGIAARFCRSAAPDRSTGRIGKNLADRPRPRAPRSMIVNEGGDGLNWRLSSPGQNKPRRLARQNPRSPDEARGFPAPERFHPLPFIRRRRPPGAHPPRICAQPAAANAAGSRPCSQSSRGPPPPDRRESPPLIARRGRLGDPARFEPPAREPSGAENLFIVSLPGAPPPPPPPLGGLPSALCGKAIHSHTADLELFGYLADTEAAFQSPFLS